MGYLHCCRSYRVSIPSQPEGRELPKAQVISLIVSEFQSPPSPKAGSYFIRAEELDFYRVSIPSQPEGRELHNPRVEVLIESIVSIPSQPEGRELPDSCSKPSNMSSFQSPPSPKAGSYFLLPYPRHFLCAVSIPSQPEGRELLEPRIDLVFAFEFQSPPSPKAGSYLGHPLGNIPDRSFNPLPARRPGATLGAERDTSFAAVSIPSQPEGRELQSKHNMRPYFDCVSIPSQPEGRELHRRVRE